MADVPVIAVAGPIGAGKSTVTTGLARATGFRAWLERVEENPFFERFCAEPGTWALHSQLAFMLGAIEDINAARQHPPGAILERPIQEMLGVFVADQFKHGVVDADEYRTLERLVEIAEALSGVPDVLVVLEGDPELLVQRVRARARSGEEAYDLEYMRRLDSRYREWADAWSASPVVRVDIAVHDLRSTNALEALVADIEDSLCRP